MALSRTKRWIKVSRARVLFQIALHIVIVIHVVAWYLGGYRGIGGLDFQDFFHHFVGSGTITAAVVFAGAIYLLSIVFGRLFCSWGCHFGAVQDLAAWILRRLGWRFRPVRTRWLHLGPWVVLALVFLAPSIERWVGAGWRPELASGAKFAGDGPWERLPGWFGSIATFVVCGGVILLFLGTRGFCRFVCPYGAVFRITDRVAPWRVRRTGECAPKCAESAAPPCTRVCPTAISVHDEVTRLGSVEAVDCVRCHLCIEACPSRVLAHTRVGVSCGGASAWRGDASGAKADQADPISSVEVASPAAMGGVTSKPLVGAEGRRGASRRAGFTLTCGEEITFLVASFATWLMIDLVYGPHFLAATLALGFGAATVGILRLVRRKEARIGRLSLRRHGRFRPLGVAAVTLWALGLLLALEAGVYRTLLFRGQSLFEQAVERSVEAEAEARELFERSTARARAALTLFPSRPEPRELLVRGYEALGNPQAVAEARFLSNLFPNHEGIRALLRRVLVRFEAGPIPDGGGERGR